MAQLIYVVSSSISLIFIITYNHKASHRYHGREHLVAVSLYRHRAVVNASFPPPLMLAEKGLVTSTLFAILNASFFIPFNHIYRSVHLPSNAHRIGDVIDVVRHLSALVRVTAVAQYTSRLQLPHNTISATARA